MVQSCLRTKMCKLCWTFLLVALCCVSLALWYRAVQEGSVQLVIPGEPPDVGGLTITILPEEPVVREGDTAQLVCIATGASVTQFQPPSSLSPSLLSSVHVTLLGGGAVMAVERAARGHAGFYTCQAVGPSAQELQLSVKLNIETIGGEYRPSSSSHPSHPSLSTLISSTSISHQNSSDANDPGVTSSSSPQTQTDLTVQEEGLWRRDTGQLVESHHQRERGERMGYDKVSLFQKAAVVDYCSRYDPAPSHTSHPLAYSRHNLLDHTHRVLFCFLPKVGCTNLKLLFFASQGLIPYSELEKPRDLINQEKLMAVVHRLNLQGNRIGFREDLRSLDYFKYVMVRNPLERLVSAYRSKIGRYNLTGALKDTPHYNWARREIFKHLHPIQYRIWAKEGMSRPVKISFGDFITYWLQPDLIEFKYDDHFMSFLHICQPCRTGFDFYGNFRHFVRDAQVLIDKVGGSSSDLRQGYYSDDTLSTDERMKLYYSTLSQSQKTDILRKMALELEFHYTIFPEERDSHKQILGVDFDLELPQFHPL